MPAVHWTPEMLETFSRLRNEGVPLYHCAERIGVAYQTAVYMARKLGLAKRMNRGRRPGKAIIAGGA